jgi:hypothetical protein
MTMSVGVMKELIAIYLGFLPLSLLGGWGMYYAEEENFWFFTGVFALLWTVLMSSVALAALLGL